MQAVPDVGGVYSFQDRERTKVSILTKLHVVTVQFEGARKHLNAVYFPTPLQGTDGALKRSFNEFERYLQDDGDSMTLWPSGERVHRKPYVMAHVYNPPGMHGPVHELQIQFQHCGHYDQRYTELHIAPSEVLEGFSLVFRWMVRAVQIKALNRRMVLAMGQHARLGRQSLIRELDAMSLGLIAQHLFF